MRGLPTSGLNMNTMKIVMLEGHEDEFPMVDPLSVDPAYWVDEDSMGPSFAEMRKEFEQKKTRTLKKKLKKKSHRKGD